MNHTSARISWKYEQKDEEMEDKQCKCHPEYSRGPEAGRPNLKSCQICTFDGSPGLKSKHQNKSCQYTNQLDHCISESRVCKRVDPAAEAATAAQALSANLTRAT